MQIITWKLVVTDNHSTITEDRSLVRFLSDDISRGIIEADSQARLVAAALRLSATQLRRLPPHHLSVHPTPVVRQARVVVVVIELLLRDPRLHRRARRHGETAGPELVPAVSAIGQVGEAAVLFVPLKPRRQAGGFGQRRAPLERRHPHLRPCLIVCVQVLLRCVRCRRPCRQRLS